MYHRCLLMVLQPDGNGSDSSGRSMPLDESMVADRVNSHVSIEF